MRHFPIYLDLKGKLVVLSGAGPVAVPKLRLLLKTSARIRVFGSDAEETVKNWAAADRLELHERDLGADDLDGVSLLYCANDDDAKDSKAAAHGARSGALVNIVDNLESSEFITPAIVDRDPVTVAIGTEGAAPVLARMIKADVETRLPVSLGILAREGQKFRTAASVLRPGRERREFWSRYFSEAGPRALAAGGRAAARNCLRSLLHGMKTRRQEHGKVAFVGAGPGDPDLMTVKARRLVDSADFVIHDSTVPKEILELARREAEFIEIGNAHPDLRVSGAETGRLIVERARQGALIVRLMIGDLDEHANVKSEMAAVAEADLDWDTAHGMPSRKREQIYSSFFAYGSHLPDVRAFKPENFAASARNDANEDLGAEFGLLERRSFGRGVPASFLPQTEPGAKDLGVNAREQALEPAA